MRSLTRKGETIIRELEILADGNQRRVDQALSCRAIGRQRTLLDVVDDMLHDCVEPADPAVRESWRQAARAALAEAKPARVAGALAAAKAGRKCRTLLRGNRRRQNGGTIMRVRFFLAGLALLAVGVTPSAGSAAPAAHTHVRHQRPSLRQRQLRQLHEEQRFLQQQQLLQSQLMRQQQEALTRQQQLNQLRTQQQAIAQEQALQRLQMDQIQRQNILQQQQMQQSMLLNQSFRSVPDTGEYARRAQLQQMEFERQQQSQQLQFDLENRQFQLLNQAGIPR